MITIDTPLEYVVVCILLAWLVASVLSAIGVRAFTTPPLVAFRLFMPWWLFAAPEGFFHTLEYLDTTGEHPTWVVAASTRSHLHLPLLLISRAALLSDHLDYTTFHLDKALRRRSGPRNTSLIKSIETNLGRHPAIRVLRPGRPGALRVMRRGRASASPVDRVVWQWTPTGHD